MTDWRRRPRPQRPRRRWNSPRVASVRSWGILDPNLRDASLRPKSLEDHLVGIARGLALVIRAAHGPSEQREAQDAACDRGPQRWQVAQRVSDELRARGHHLCEVHYCALGRGRDLAPSVGFRDHAARELRRGGAQIHDLRGIERHHRGRAAIARQHAGGAAHEPPIAVEPALQFDDQRSPAGHEVAQFAKRDHAVAGRLEGNALELDGGRRVEPSVAFGEAAERIVVVHHGLAVRADLQIAFDAVMPRDRGGECRGRVLDDGFLIMQPTVRHGSPRAVRAADRDRPWTARQPTSKMPSTSTAASPGSTATPTVVRACRPLSPSAATMRSEAPFITLGPSRKPGSELMKPPKRITCLTLSRSPSAALTWASTLTAQARAAFWPSSRDTPLPSLPLATSLPLASRQIWPETNSSVPTRTKGM